MQISSLWHKFEYNGFFWDFGTKFEYKVFYHTFEYRGFCGFIGINLSTEGLGILDKNSSIGTFWDFWTKFEHKNFFGQNSKYKIKKIDRHKNVNPITASTIFSHGH